MEEELNVKFNKTIRFKKGQSIKVSIELDNVEFEQYRNVKDFLDVMFKEIKKLF